MKRYKNIIKLACFLFLTTSASAQTPKAYLVANAHLDTQWNWDVQTTIKQFLPNTMNRNLYLLSKYPDYVFNFEGGVRYSWMKEYYPKQYALMKKYIATGRWHIAGSSWDANDTNIPSPESATRNFLYGQHFYLDEFGVESTDVFLPDCFGFSWTLPSIASHCGLIGFSTQKLQWRTNPFYGNSKVPFDIGYWKGVDGERMLSALNGHNYDTKWNDEDLSNSSYLYNLANGNPQKKVFHYYGVGDAGGSPTEESIRAVSKGISGSGRLDVVGVPSDQLFKDLRSEGANLPVFGDELLLDVHATGCYTSQSALKLYNRRNELLADAAERSAVIADWFGATKYPKKVLTEAWQRVIWHQFHDDLPGTSIPKAYEFSWNDELISMKQFANVLTTSVGGVSRALNTNVEGTPLVIFNPISHPVSDVVEVKVKMPSDSNISVYDENGNEVPSQKLAYENGMIKMLVAVSAPSIGYVVYDIKSTASNLEQLPITATNKQLENSVYKVSLDANGDISSIIDKRNQKELVQTGKSIRLALFTDNESFDWPAWEIKKTTIDQKPIAITSNVTFSVIEAGQVRATICVERKHNESVVKQYISLSEGGQKDRIDIYNEIDWNTKNALLKAEFPLNVSNTKATYDLGLGAIQRGNNKITAYEVCAQQWADLTNYDKAYGVSVLNNSKYGWDKPNDNTLRLTLLHTPKTKGNYTYQDQQDLGYHTFKYSIYGHEGVYTDAETVLKAEVLNQPLKAFVTPKRDGGEGSSFSFAQLDNPNILIRAMKQAEKSDEYIIRLYETAGESTQLANLSFASNIVAAKELNGIEKEIGDASFSNEKLAIEIAPFSIKTYKVKLATPPTTLTESNSTTVSLNHNIRTASTDKERGLIDFDGKGNSYAAELLPAQIESQGIQYSLAKGNANNALRCSGNVIELPTDKEYKKLFLLVASAKNDNQVNFKLGNKTQPIDIPSYSGYIGQWGHKGHTEEYLKSADIAYIGTHKHGKKNNKWNEVFDNTTDKSATTKYTIVNNKNFWLYYHLPEAKEVKSYALSVPATTNYTSRNPKDWVLMGLDAQTNIWIELDKRTGMSFPTNGSTLMFDLQSSKKCLAYSLEVLANNGGSDVHLLQWQLFDAPQIGVGIENEIMDKLDELITVTASNNKIVIKSDLPETMYSIFNTLGVNVTNGRFSDPEIEIPAQSGFYIVRANNVVKKILVK